MDNTQLNVERIRACDEDYRLGFFGVVDNKTDVNGAEHDKLGLLALAKGIVLLLATETAKSF